MKIICSAVRRSALSLVLLAGFGSAQAALVNGDFEAGGLSGWTLYTTGNGTLGTGGATVSTFDVAGKGTASATVGLSVGYSNPPCSFPGIYCPYPTEGGGVRQTSIFSGGLTWLQADVAVTNSSLFGFNLDGGTFSLILDGLLLDSFSVTNIAAGSSQRGHLDATTLVTAGSHTLEILVTRQSAEALSLVQYIDNVSASAVPEPTSTSLVGLGLLVLMTFRKKNAAASAID
jgi:hypothetical protein